MKKAKSELNDWLRPEYKRSDFGKLVRGKYASRIQKSTNVIVLDPHWVLGGTLFLGCLGLAP